MNRELSTSDRQILRDNPLGTSQTLEDIIDNFEFLDDWESRYGYIIDLGKLAPALPEAHRSEENRVLGCQSQVWFLAAPDSDDTSSRLLVLIDSDAMIVKGLAAIVMAALNGKPAEEVASYDMNALFSRLDLIRHLSPTRGNGLRAMVSRIQEAARSQTA